METMDFGRIRLEIEGQLAIIRLNDPERLNALTLEMADGLALALLEIAKPRRGIRCLLLTGEGRGFCAGLNLAGKAREIEGSANLPALGAVETRIHPLIRRFRDVEIPIVAAINGPCVGIGFSLMLLSDYVIVSDSAYFLVPFRNLASCTDSGLSWLLPRAVGVARAGQLILRADRLPAEKALDWGLVNEVVTSASLNDAARKVADEFATGPTVALSLMKGLIRDAGNQALDSHLEAEARGVARSSRTKDNNAAIRAFGSKQPPEFVGA